MIVGVCKMAEKQLDMKELEEQVAFAESDAKKEEQNHADENYYNIKKQIQQTVTKMNSVKESISFYGSDDKSQWRYEQKREQPYLEEKRKLEKYYEDESLYIGHLRTKESDYYIMDNTLESKFFNFGLNVINADSRKYADLIKKWRFPKESSSVEYSRNIDMRHRKVENVDVLYDSGSSAFSDITDAYLRKALIRNKERTGAQSIIQTIQMKQDHIRSLSKDSSFIVQGCAGSGKTMVLLHRLRYLLYNREFGHGDYLFLVPGNGFKKFIESTSTDFKIRDNNIVPYQEYYKSFFNVKPSEEKQDISELVFPPEFLSYVYSKEFIQTCYKEFFDSFEKQTNDFIDYCDEKLNKIIESENVSLTQKIDNIQTRALKKVEELTKNFKAHLITQIDENFDDIPDFIEELTTLYNDHQKSYEYAVNPNVEIVISPDDERILNDLELTQIRNELDKEKIASEKASIFTALAHRNKLRQLKSRYDNTYNIVLSRLIEEDRKKYIEKAKQLRYVFGDITLSSLHSILIDLNNIYNTAKAELNGARNNLDNINAYIEKKYSEEIANLSSLIESSADLSANAERFISDLEPCHEFLLTIAKPAMALRKKFESILLDDENGNTQTNNFTFFSARTENEFSSDNNSRILNICKQNIKQKYGIKICDLYKHYWYILLYCKYLTRPLMHYQRSFIFIDEAQDLSVSEIELIRKLNRFTSPSVSSIYYYPVINLFGDTNQMISSHGINDWSLLSDYFDEIYTLDENFRNTDQIVEYCNKHLSIHMTDVGVKMENVDEYASLDDMVYNITDILSEPVFIVKDEHVQNDLEKELERIGFVDHKIFTVKSVKGLEFKEIFVFDSDMTENEKYISYTRALVKLNVIKSLPVSVDRSNDLFIQGNNENDYE